MKNLTLNNSTYKVIDKISTIVPDCFVKRNKLVTEKNKYKDKPSSGESRIYIGSQALLTNSNFFTFPNSVTYLKNTFNSADKNNCIFTKNNLLNYLNNAYSEYVNPSLNFFYDITVDYQSYMNKLKNLDDTIAFTIFNHKGSKDASRFYINSLDDIWKYISSSNFIFNHI